MALKKFRGLDRRMLKAFQKVAFGTQKGVVTGINGRDILAAIPVGVGPGTRKPSAKLSTIEMVFGTNNTNSPVYLGPPILTIHDAWVQIQLRVSQALAETV